MRSFLRRLFSGFGERKFLRAENDRLLEQVQAENDRLHRLCDALMEPGITAMEIRGRGLFIQPSKGLAAEMMAMICSDALAEVGAENFVEFQMDDRGRKLVVTIQKATGKTPGQLLGEAKAQVKKLEWALSAHDGLPGGLYRSAGGRLQSAVPEPERMTCDARSDRICCRTIEHEQPHRGVRADGTGYEWWDGEQPGPSNECESAPEGGK